MKVKLWWKRMRKTDHPIWHFMINCPSLPFEAGWGIAVEKNPRSGSKCDFCQNLQKKEKSK